VRRWTRIMMSFVALTSGYSWRSGSARRSS
jgi:hypothetical protein